MGDQLHHEPEIIAWIAMDERFCNAMREAAMLGKERPPAFQVFVDPTPPPPGARLYPRVSPERSLLGSVAGECAAFGDNVTW